MNICVGKKVLSLKSLTFYALTTPDKASGLSCLQSACIKGDIETVNAILNYSRDKLDSAIALSFKIGHNSSNLSGKTILTVLKQQTSERHKQINELVESVTKPFQSQSLMYVAAKHGNVEHLRRLLDDNEYVDSVDKLLEKGETPLVLAARFNDVDVVEFLVERGASLEIHDKYGYFPIHHAAIGGKTRNIRCLKDAGADISKATNRFYAGDWITPVCLAAQYGHIEAMEFLLKHGANPNETNSHGETPLHLAARNGHLETIELLLRKGGNLNGGDNDGYLPLHYAAKMEHTDVVNFILQNGGSATAKTHHGQTVLHFVTRLDLVSFLVENGADVNARHNYGRTPLMAAAGKGQTDTVTYLLNQGANINAREDSCGCSALYDALQNGHVATAKVLIEKGIELKIVKDEGYGKSLNPWLMSEAASKGLTDVLELLLQTGLSVDTQDFKGETPLIAAARAGHCATVALLLDRGANINGGDAGSVPDDSVEFNKLLRHSPLYCALQCGHGEVAKLLIERGANTLNSNNGNNVLTELATNHGLSDIVDLLVCKDTVVFP